MSGVIDITPVDTAMRWYVYACYICDARFALEGHCVPEICPQCREVFRHAPPWIGEMYSGEFDSPEWPTADQRSDVKAQPKVYLIRSGDLLKIGVSVNPQKRLKKLKTGCAFPPSVAKTWDTDDAYGDERTLHAMFSSKRTFGEWFSLDDGDIERIDTYFSSKARAAINLH